MEFEARYFDGKSSRAYRVRVGYDGQSLIIRQVKGKGARKVLFDDCSISPALGNTPRTISLPGGALCETSDLEAVRGLEQGLELNRGMRLVGFLEGHWRMVAIATLGLVLAISLSVRYGIPAASEKVAYMVGIEILEQMTESTMDVLDSRFMSPSKLEEERKAAIAEAFGALHAGEYNYTLEFRNSPGMGPNAFALPSGLIVMTDQMVELSEDTRELEGVLLHEIAHVQKRHGVRSILQSAGVFLLISAVVGDVTSITSAAGSLPTILARSGYSRGFEREADMFAAEGMVRLGYGTKPLSDILTRITEGRKELPGEGIYSTHPVMRERVKFLMEFEATN